MTRNPYKNSNSDPMKYQFKDVKRRLTKAEAKADRQHTKIVRLQSELAKIREVLEAVVRPVLPPPK